jgi:hypothetical protein
MNLDNASVLHREKVSHEFLGGLHYRLRTKDSEGEAQVQRKRAVSRGERDANVVVFLRRLIEIALLVVFCLCPGKESWAEMTGRYYYIGGAVQQDARQRQIDLMVQRINFLLRPIARRALDKVCKLPPYVDIRTKNGLVGIEMPPVPVRWSRLDGQKTAFLNVRGREATLQRRWQGQTIHEVLTEGRSKRILSYVFSQQYQRVTLRYSIRSPHLPQDLLYWLNYAKRRREGAMLPASEDNS